MTLSIQSIAAPATGSRKSDRRLARLAGMGMAALILALGACSSGPDGRRTGSQPPVQGGYKIGVPYQITGVWYYPKEDFKYDRTGIASWYGHPFHGRTSASGERYNMEAMTAAHKTLPMPSLVEVTNLENGRRLVLRVNDRGPFVSGRIIDVSRGAARKLGFKGSGIAKVRVRILERESRQMKQLALANMTGRARALAARRQRRAATRAQVAVRQPETRPVERRAYTPSAATGVGSVQPARAQPLKPAAVAKGPIYRAPKLQQRAAAPIAVSRSARNQGSIRVTDLPPSRAASSPKGATDGIYRPKVVGGSRGGAGPGRVVGRREHDTRTKASVIRAPRPAYRRPVAQSRPANGTELPGRIFVQAGAFRDRINANRMRNRLATFGSVRVVPVRVGGARYFRVRVGPVVSASQGNRLLARVVDAGYPRAQIVID